MKTPRYVFYLMKAVLVLLMFISFTACEEEQEVRNEDQIVGQPGNPRFNLQFSNGDGVDLDLYVQDPNGEVIYFGDTFSYSGGQLDVDCACFDCPNGPNENIFWPTDGSAPSGTYKFWVEYFGSCDFSSASSSYTLRVMQNGSIMDTKTGSLSNGSSPVYTYHYSSR